MLETILPLIAGLVGGSLGKSAIDWMRGKKLDVATVHKADTDALLISTQMVKTWLHDAGQAQVTIHQMLIASAEKDITIIGQKAKIENQDVMLQQADNQMKALTESLQRCHDNLEKCREGCK